MVIFSKEDFRVAQLLNKITLYGQVQGARMPTTTSAGTGSSSHLGRRDADQRRYLRNQRSSTMSNSNVATINTRNAAIEARDRLAERLRGAALLSHRFSIFHLTSHFQSVYLIVCYLVLLS